MKDEEELKRELRPLLLESFIVKEEVTGAFLVDGSKVRIDFLLFPKPELIEKGFDEIWFGLEVKSQNVKSSSANGLRLSWQCVTYSQSKFNDIRPEFVLMYPPLWDFFYVLKNDGSRTYDKKESHWLKCFLAKANVGNFIKHSYTNGWKIEFGAGQTYYSTDKGRSKIKNIGTRRVVGSWK